VNTISQGGTALAEAINTALKAFKEGDSYKVLVMFTDGEDNDQGALEAAQSAAKAGLRIFTIGIGTAEGELLRITDAKGRADYIRDEQGNVVKSHLNEKLLQQIAGATEGGLYLPLRGAKTIETLYENRLAPLPKSEGQEKRVRRYQERYHWPLAAAIALLLVEMLFPERKRETRVAKNRSSPENLQGSEPRKGGTPNAVVTVSTAVLALLLLPGVAFSSSSSAFEDYHAKKFTNAQKEYERLAQADKTGDLRLTFNAGAAAYQATNYDAAIKHFTSALAAPDVKLQQAAYFNLGNAQFRIGQSAKDLDGLQQSWETAIKSYQNAVALDKNDADAAFNLAFTTNAVEQIKQFKEALRHAKSDADAAVRRAEFHRALEIMLPLQKTIAAKQFEEFTKKLKDVDDIATPHQP
jgi:Ca-activated chloride channel homolog